MERKAFMCDMIRTELEDIVGVENVSTKDSDRATYGVDYFWIGRMWVDHGLTPPMPDIIVRPGCTEEVSKILKIANYYKIPVNIWGGGSGSQGGKIDDMCISMEVVLPNGDIINTLPVPKHAAGPDLNEIFIGSEGTLGVITKATFKLFEQPESRQHRAFLFPDMHSGYMAGRDIMQKVKPSILRFFDEAETVSIIKKILGFEKKGCFMNVTLEGMKKIVDIELEIVEEIAAKWGAQDLGGEYGEKWYENRITFFYPGNIMDIPQMFGTMDTVATYANIEKIYLAMKKVINEKFPYVKYISHSSHWYEWGCMNYTRFIVDPAHVPSDPDEAIRLHNQIWNAGVRAAMENGGVINDHHGIGLKLSRLMKEQYGPAMQVMESLKKGLDPNGIMNPYKLGL